MNNKQHQNVYSSIQKNAPNALPHIYKADSFLEIKIKNESNNLEFGGNKYKTKEGKGRVNGLPMCLKSKIKN